MLAIIIHSCQICIFQEVEKGLDKTGNNVGTLCKKIFLHGTLFFCAIETTYIIQI